MISPRVSIIIPAYNVENYIHECLESVTSQTFSDMEIIVINDGSDDKTSDIVRDFNDSRIQLVEQEHSGLSIARNKGISMAKGNYILCVDSDDCISPETIAICYSKAQRNNAEVVTFDGFDFSMKSGKRKIHKNNYFNRSRKLEEGLYKARDFFHDTIHKKAVLVCVPFYFIKKSLLLELPFQEGILHEDVYFHYELLAKMKNIYYLPLRCYERRIRKGSIINTPPSTLTFISYYKICNNLYKNYTESTEYFRPLWKKAIRKNMLQVGKLANQFFWSSKENKKEAKRLIKKTINNGNFSIRLQNYIAYYKAFIYSFFTSSVSK